MYDLTSGCTDDLPGKKNYPNFHKSKLFIYVEDLNCVS